MPPSTDSSTRKDDTGSAAEYEYPQATDIVRVSTIWTDGGSGMYGTSMATMPADAADWPPSTTKLRTAATLKKYCWLAVSPDTVQGLVVGAIEQLPAPTKV